MRTANIFIALIFLIFAGCYGVLIFRLPDRNLPHTLGPAFMPWVLAGFLTVLSILLLMGALSSEKDDTHVSLPIRDLAGITGLVLLIGAYIKLMGYLGFIVVTPFFLMVLTWFAGSRNAFGIVIFSATTTTAIYLLFHNFFSVQLPAGIFF